jgi:hypothetical protein
MGNRQSSQSQPKKQPTMLFSSQALRNDSLTKIEPLRVIHNILDFHEQRSIKVELLTAAKFVGTIDGDGFTSMACLIEDGTVLTTLHSIFDFEKESYIDLRDLTVSFVHNSRLFTYPVREIKHDGLTAARANMNQFDYACLSVGGDPVKDLGGGLILDPRDHWGNGSNDEPPQTQAISGPLLGSNEEGKIVANQWASFSRNAAAQSPYYFFSQEGDHHGNPGFSGQAILYPNTNILYAIHVGLEHASRKRTGIKISEYRLACKTSCDLPTSATFQHKSEIVDIITNFQRERLRHKGQDISDLEKFLDELSKVVASEGKKIFTITEISKELQLRIVDTHQGQHLKGSSYRLGKGYFYDFLGTSDKSLVINALANCVNKLVSEYYQRNMKTSDSKKNANIRRTAKFVVDLGVPVGVDVAARSHAKCVLIEGFGGRYVHIYPIVPDNLQGTEPIIIDARATIAEAKQRREDYKMHGNT